MNDSESRSQKPTHLRKLYDVLPESVKAAVRGLAYKFPLSNVYKRDTWIRNVYSKFGNEQRKYIFLSISRFCHINRPVTGYYFEFGCHEANTIRIAFDAFHHLHDWTYVAFDSFEGLPEVGEIDRQEIWEKGKLKTSEEDFTKMVVRHGLPREKLITVKGFYDASLTDELTSRLLPTKAAVIYVDCDLYESTIPVLEFIKPFLQRGTIIVFDDWNCFHGDPDRGERRAFREFLEREPQMKFEEFVHTNEANSFIYLGENE
jgi:O-methyltransferase